MNVENFIKDHALCLKNSSRNIEIAPDISNETKEKWCKAYKNFPEVEKDKLLVVSFQKRIGSFALTGNSLYYDNFEGGELQVLAYKSIDSIVASKGKTIKTDALIITSGETELHLDACFDGIDVKSLEKILTEIIKIAKKTDLTSSNQTVPLYKLSDELKLLYLKILCNYAYIGDGIIDSDEYNAIISFCIRMEFTNTQKELRYYMNNMGERIKTGELINIAKKIIKDESGQWDTFRYSLMQDILFLHEIHNKNISWKKDGFIGSLMEACQLHKEQIATMQRAVTLNKKMQEKNADFGSLQGEWDSFINEIEFTPSYVPKLFLFCSGSVYGIDGYKYFFMKNDTSQKAINKQRELFLQQIILNGQKTINRLIDDLQALCDELDSIENDAITIQQKYENLKLRIEGLARQKNQKE